MRNTDVLSSTTARQAIIPTQAVQQARPWVKFKARRLMAKLYRIPVQQSDVEQMLFEHLVANLHHFDPTRAKFITFANVVLDRCCASILRSWRAGKRDPKCEECSLQEIVQEDDERYVFRSETTPELGRDPWPDIDRRLDFEARIKQLSPNLQEVVELGLQGHKVPQILLLELKRHLQDSGLDIYLK